MFDRKKNEPAEAKKGRAAVWTNGRRIAFACLCLLVMIPAALAYAGGGQLSGNPQRGGA